MNGIIRVLLVGGNEVMREELSRILGSEEEIIVVGEARGGEETLAEARKLSPDVVIALTDDRMLGANISDTARAITEAQLPFKVIIIAENPVRYLVPTIKAGVAGLLPRNISRDDLVSAIRKIHLWHSGSFSPGNNPAGPGYHVI